MRLLVGIGLVVGFMVAVMDPTIIGAAVGGVVAAASGGAVLYVNARSSAARDREKAASEAVAAAVAAAERAKDREEAAAIRAKDREEAAEDRRIMIAKASQSLAVSEANGKKSDEIITGVAKVHELGNSTNSNLQSALSLMTEKLAGAERMITLLMQQIKDTATSQATADLQVSAAMHTTPVVTATAARTPDQRVGDEETLRHIETHTKDTAANTARTEAVVQNLKDSK